MRSESTRFFGQPRLTKARVFVAMKREARSSAASSVALGRCFVSIPLVYRNGPCEGRHPNQTKGTRGFLVGRLWKAVRQELARERQCTERRSGKSSVACPHDSSSGCGMSGLLLESGAK